MRLRLDMGLAPRTAELQRRHGHDALHLAEQGHQRLPDEDVMAKAAAERRVLVTFDLDFARLLALQRLSQPSVVLLRLEQFTTDSLGALLLRLLQQHKAPLARGAIVVVDEQRVRLRGLPVW
jgi:predicted nuclease of predicted toxin-antitoxin system